MSVEKRCQNAEKCSDQPEPRIHKRPSYLERFTTCGKADYTCAHGKKHCFYR